MARGKEYRLSNWGALGFEIVEDVYGRHGDS